MTTVNQRPTELMAVLSSIDMESQSTGTEETARIKADKFHQYLAEIGVGTLGSSATINAKIRKHTAATSGTSVDLAGAAITEIDTAGQKKAFINIDPNDLGVHTNGDPFAWISLQVIVGTAASVTMGELKGFFPKSAPSTGDHIARVAQIVDA